MQKSLSKTRILGFPVSVINHRRWLKFKQNRRAFVSLWLFVTLFFLSIFAEILANERPILIKSDDGIFFPVFKSYSEETFGGDFPTEADYKDPYVQELIVERNGWIIWPPIPYNYATVANDIDGEAPSPPDSHHWLGTDDQARDVLARVIYGFRLSIVFGLVLTVISSIVGILAGATQGYFGGLLDLIAQRFIEIWSSMPYLYILIILSSVIVPGFWTLLFLLLLFSWMSLVGVVRAECLRVRNLDYVKAATALGVGNWQIITRHVLPNALVATVTFLPFIMASSVTALTGLDFLGFGLPPGSPSLGELLQQGNTNRHAIWLGLSGFVVIGMLLSLLVFIGEGIRDAFDPRKAVVD